LNVKFYLVLIEIYPTKTGGLLSKGIGPFHTHSLNILNLYIELAI